MVPSGKVSTRARFVLLTFCLCLPACAGSEAQLADKKGNGNAELDKKSEIEREREKLFAERLDLERQRAEMERQKREALEAQIRAKEAAERSQEFSTEEFRVVKDQVERGADSLGRLLLGGTHPTGTYSYTSSPLVTLSSDRRDVTVAVTVSWKGGLTENPYVTAYSCTLNKKTGVGTLQVQRDTALIKIDPQFLKSTEYAIRDMFSPRR